MTKSKQPQPSKPLADARDKTDRVQNDLKVAGAELGLAHDALQEHLPPEAKQGDVAWAISQNAAVGRKLEDAVEELEEVTDLLQEEAAERARLEEALAQAGRA